MNNWISDMFDHVKTFEMKLWLRETRWKLKTSSILVLEITQRLFQDWGVNSTIDFMTLKKVV